ncbi:hypothetical protein [Streptomyces sp. NPDC002225]|uniref:hypothetical protein n=1 Tax=Streptomyces sp. NPDC002225 TaxID=3154413 RepID=UPI003328750F
MAVTKWEEALGLVSDQEGGPVDRAEVTKLKWLGDTFVAPHHLEGVAGTGGAPGGYDLGWNKRWYNGAFYNYQVGFNVSADLKDPLPQDQAIYKWHFGARELLATALGEVGNTVFSLHSFDDASWTVKGVQRFLDEWFHTVKGWSEEIDVPDSEMQGTAAGQFRSMLIGVANQFGNLHTQMTNPRDFSKEIDDARQEATRQLQSLYQVIFAYGTENNAWPAQILSDLFHEEFAEGAYTFDNGWLKTSLGDPHGSGFWEAFEAKAKQRWLDQVGASLDGPARDAGKAIGLAYGLTEGAIRVPTKPPWDAPAGTDKGGLNPDGSTTSDTIADLLKGLTNPTGDDKNLPGGDNTELQKEDSPGAFSDGDSSGQSGLDKDGPGSTLQDQLKNLNASGPGSFGTDNVTGNGGSGLDNTGLGNTGLGNTGTDTDQNTSGPGSFGPGGLMNIPPGSTLNKNGTVTGPDGKPLRNSDGSLYKTTPGAFQQQQKQQSQQETLRRQAEAEQKAYQQQAKEQQEAQRRAEQQRRENEKALSRLRETSRLSSDHSGLRTGGEGGSQQSKGVFKVRNPDGTFSEYTSGKGGRTSIGVEPTGKVRTTSVDPSAKVVEEAAANRRTSSQSPMMPPPGAGAGAGAGAGQDQHRERKSYLDEDEETWGTQECTTTGVIG